MYLNYYELKSKPFDLLPDHRFLFMSREHDLALTHLEYGITDNKGFIVLTGDVGAGKTTLINYLLNKIKEEVNTALVFNTNIDPASFLEMVVKEFGLRTKETRKSVLYDILYQFLLEEHVRGRRSVLIIDEAQNMPKETLEEVRMLSNFETQESYLLQIIMGGQPQLKRRLNDPDLAQLTQRVSVYYHLSPLEESEVGRYIDHRLRVAGYNSPYPLFETEAVEKIYEYSKGVPRVISSICDTALIYGYADELKTIGEDVIEKVIEDRTIDVVDGDGDPVAVDHGGVSVKGEEGTFLAQNALENLRHELLNFSERLTWVERKLDEAAKVRNQETTVHLMNWLKEAQEENKNLQKKYFDLLHNFRKVMKDKNTDAKEEGNQVKKRKGWFGKKK